MGIGITKGNWQIVRKGNTVQSLSIMSENVDKICHGISPRHIANAKLIAAAPDLLEICQKLLMDLKNGCITPASENRIEEVEKAIEKALK